MRLAVIDLGTNSVRFDVHQILPGEPPHRLYREKLMVRLGERVFLDGRLDPVAIQRTTQSFQSFQEILSRLNVDKVVAFATCTLREAVDSEKLLRSIQEKTGIELRVITGKEEARLIALGIMSYEKIGKGPVGLVDIGGGSTEISIVKDQQVKYSDSFSLGTARLQQVYLKSSPPADGTISELRKHIRHVLRPKIELESWPEVSRVIGSSGTVRSLAKLIKQNSEKNSLDRAQLKQVIKMMSKLSPSELLELPGMEHKRIDMILSGAILLDEVMAALGAEKFSPTEFSLRDGILHHEKQQKFPVATFPNFDSAFERVFQFRLRPEQTKKMLTIADTCFDGLQSLHRLKTDWKYFLLAATAFRNLGEVVSFAQYDAHSFYVVSHMDFPWRATWEADFVARLCLYHRHRKLNVKSLSFRDDPIRFEAFIRLLAILKIVDAFDVGEGTSVSIRDIHVSRKNVEITYEAKGLFHVPCLKLERQRELFETVFGCSVTSHHA